MNNNIYIETKIDNLVIGVYPKEINKTLPDTLLLKIKNKYGNKCYKDFGYIEQNSIEMLKHELPRMSGSTTTGIMTCRVTIKCTICRPFNGAHIKCRIFKAIEYTSQDRIYLAESGPLVIYLRLSINDKDELSIRDVVTVEIKKFRMNDHTIDVYASFVSKLEELNYYDIPEKTNSNINFVDTITYKTSLKEYNYLEDISFIKELGEVKTGIEAINKKFTVKNKKATAEETDEWRCIRDIINPYELVHPAEYYNDSVVDKEKFYSAINELGNKNIKLKKVINRAYYKMWEILHDKKQDKWGEVIARFNNRPINVLGIAEAPGGFLQAIMDTRLMATNGSFSTDDKYRGISLNADIKWRSSILDLYKEKFNIDIKYGYGKNNGDLRDVDEHIYIQEELLENNKAEIIVADGGIDVSDDYLSQEIQNHKLGYSEILVALSNQALGGVFIMKCYDIYTSLGVQYLTILKNYYDKVYLIKPELSRPANSEKYIVALNYNGKFNKAMQDRSRTILSRWTNDKYVVDLLAMPDENIMSSMNFINGYFANRQINFIKEGLNLQKFNSKNKQLEYKKKQLEISNNWCIKFDIPTKKVNLRVVDYTIA